MDSFKYALKGTAWIFGPSLLGSSPPASLGICSAVSNTEDDSDKCAATGIIWAGISVAARADAEPPFGAQHAGAAHKPAAQRPAGAISRARIETATSTWSLVTRRENLERSERLCLRGL